MDHNSPDSGRDASDGRDMTEPADGGVVRRMARRTTVSLVVIIALVAVIAVAVWQAVDIDGAGGSSVAAAILVVLALIPIAVLGRRVSLWHVAGGVVAQLSHVGDRPDTGDGWIAAACGEPVRVHRANSKFRRVDRLPPHYLPLRAESGVLRSGTTVVLHARRDGEMLRADDRLELLALGASRRGPFLVRRRDDGLIFVADGWLLSAA